MLGNMISAFGWCTGRPRSSTGEGPVASSFRIFPHPPAIRWTPLIVGYYEGDKLMFASKVRTGFVPRLRREVWHKLKVLEVAACPFVNLPRRNELSFRSPVKNEELGLAQAAISCADRLHKWTPEGHLRHSISLRCEMIKVEREA